METSFFHCLRYFLRSSSSRLVKTHLSVQKKRYWFLLRTFFLACGKRLNYREAYLKLLSLLLATILFLFFRYFCQYKQVLRLAEACSWENSPFPSSRNLLSVYWKQYSFIWWFFSVSGNPMFEQWPYSCKWKLIFWSVETIFFFHFQTLLPLITLLFCLIQPIRK